jgi:hypothetical protein
MNHKDIDVLRKVITHREKSPIRGPVDKSLDTGPVGNVSMKQPYHSIALDQIRAIKKFETKINQEARKEIVLNKVANPKVSEI